MMTNDRADSHDAGLSRTVAERATPRPHETPRRMTSSDLLQGARQVIIEHAGREYRLHLTNRGKLILTA